MVLFRGQSRSSNVESNSDYHVQGEDPATPRLLRISPLRHSYRIPPSRSLETSLYIDDSDADSIISAPAHGDDHLSKGLSRKGNFLSTFHFYFLHFLPNARPISQHAIISNSQISYFPFNSYMYVYAYDPIFGEMKR